MKQNVFFEILENHLDQQLPFVCYRKPNSLKVKAVIQKENELYTVNDYSETGFVFAPFNDKKKTVIIPLIHSELLECDTCIFDKFDTSNSRIENNSNQDEKKKHLHLVESGLSAIHNNEFQKVVLSRVELVETSNDNPIEIFKRLLSNYKNAFVYCWFHPKVGLWLGASPETLITIENNRFKTMSLAGTQQTDKATTIWTVKEKNEQQIVTDFIVEKLKPLTNSFQISDAETVQAGNLVHLKSIISGVLKDNLKSVVDALHPTPAVCGYPRQASKTFILNEEGYNREFYTGFLGELNFKEQVKRNRNKQNIENDAYNSIKTVSNLFVNLRCLQLKESKAFIYVGGGITSDSTPGQEWEETVAKTLTMKKVLY